jgi:two-component system, cell cycle sensor histidine kinase and response regulator CckA
MTDGAGRRQANAENGGGELILVVDNEEHICEMVAAILDRHGYSVVTAMDGREALGLFSLRPCEFRVVITDLKMPNLDGATLACRVHQLNPEVKILVMTGLLTGSDDPWAPQFASASIAKPFKPSALLDAVSALLRP